MCMNLTLTLTNAVVLTNYTLSVVTSSLLFDKS